MLPVSNRASVASGTATLDTFSANLPMPVLGSPLQLLSIESIFTVLALRERLVPPTANLEDKDPEIDLDVAAGSPRPLPAGQIAAINNSFGFGGHDVAVAFRSA